MSRVERGGANPSLDAIEVLASAFDVDVAELFRVSKQEIQAGRIDQGTKITGQ